MVRSRLKILIVDDEDHMLTILRTMLNAMELDSVVEARDGRGGLVACQKYDPALVITDARMAPMDGIRFVRAIRGGVSGVNRYVPILMLTAETDTEHVIRARDSGVNAFVAKPVSFNVLRERVAFALADKRPFVDTPAYVGPDRRHGRTPGYSGPERRRRRTSAPVDSSEMAVAATG
ncbi:MAG: response regulator [Alphaproteobacteria bacterium]